MPRGLSVVCVFLASAVVAGSVLAGGPPADAAFAVSEGKRVDLKYEAYVAGINAGEAALTLVRSGSDSGGPKSFSYRVAGTARSKGLWESIQPWRAEYSVDGEVRGDSPGPALSPGHFFSLQTTPRKQREIHIEQGVLREIKNHKVRDPRPAQSGFDLLSALFFLPPCHPEVQVHSGRDGYAMQRLRPKISLIDEREPAVQDDIMRCSYRVTDDDGADYRMSLQYGRRGGAGEFVVPAEIRVEGPLSARMVLVDPPRP